MMRVAILTSGGDSPGMNAAIRAAVRCGTAAGLEPIGVRRGFNGLIDGDLWPLDNRSVGGIMERGGTILRTARSQAFRTPEGQARAVKTARQNGIDGVIVIGGNGSLHGAQCLERHGLPTLGIPASIDNDVPGTTMSLGVDTALNTVVECLNRIRDTAVSHERAFVIEVMGRKSGYIALNAGLAGGAEIVLLPEIPLSMSDIMTRVRDGINRGKTHSVIVVAEGFWPTDVPAQSISPGRLIAGALEETETIESRLTILGHLQRGGSPTAFDRLLACRFGEAAVAWLGDGTSGVYTGAVGREIGAVPFTELDEPPEQVNLAMVRLANTLAH